MNLAVIKWINVATLKLASTDIQLSLDYPLIYGSSELD